jgi:diacylglycerol kinase (ATP)
MWSIRPNIGRSVASRAVRIALTANLASGGGLDPEPLVAAMERHGAEVEVFGCEAADLERLAATAPERIAVAGGDGTIGPAAEAAGRLGVPLAVIPSGTANDFARANRLPQDPEQAAVLAVVGTRTRELELGRLADGRPFVNVASAGLAAKAARHAAPFKRVAGPLAYAIGAAQAAVLESPMRCTVRADGEEVFSGGAWQVIVAVTGAFGGGSDVGVADPGDGALDVAVLPAGSRIALARRAWGLRRGTIAEQKPVTHHRGDVIEVDLSDGAELNVDGEIRDGGLERATAEHGAYALVVPGAISTPSRPRRLTS